MQMFGIGIPELLVILFLSILVVGPDRLPGFAADLARWIRRTRAYANHLMKDFHEVMGDFEKEAGASREDWKEIANVVGLHTRDVGRELTKVASQLEQAGDLAEAKAEPPPSLASPANGSSAATGAPSASGSNGAAPEEPSQEPAEGSADGAEEKPWYVPERRSRLRDE
jgi:sec-independent protein translocase protein TatB